MDREEILSKITTSNFQPVIYVESEVDSTNSYAKRLLQNGFESEAIIISEVQSSGRGRADRSWFSPSGGLYMSIILQRGTNLAIFPLFSFALAISAAEVLEKMTSLQIDLKWPNDLLVSGKKICGILSELITDNPEAPTIILGIGINLNQDIADFPKELKKTATSVVSETGLSVNYESVVSGIVNSLDKRLTRDPDLETVIEEYRPKCITIGKSVSAMVGQESVTGQVIDVNDEGSLLLRDTS
ncbi:MAG: biotin--[acetyl-CoA-carboxylase] ligase, partial [Candidatus Thorarchaeota archaeon]